MMVRWLVRRLFCVWIGLCSASTTTDHLQLHLTVPLRLWFTCRRLLVPGCIVRAELPVKTVSSASLAANPLDCRPVGARRTPTTEVPH